jgi:hypothetical protein
MSIDEIRSHESHRNAKPPRPFVLRLAQGTHCPVAEPQRIAIASWSPLGIFVGKIPHTPRAEDAAMIERSEPSPP